MTMAARESTAPKVVLVVLDGLGAETAFAEFGWLEALTAAGRAARWSMTCCLPSLSRPLYHTLLSGLPPLAHGIVSNDINVPAGDETVFTVARTHGRKTAASASHWFAELYHANPYSPAEHREVDDPQAVIQHGRYYSTFDCPDEEVFHAAGSLIRRHAPDFLLLHAPACDTIGHRFGGQSPEYRRTASMAGDLIARYGTDWLERGYRLVVTADHGMDDIGWHGGTRPAARQVPFYVVGARVSGVQTATADQLSVAPTVLSLLGLPVAPAMAGVVLG